MASGVIKLNSNDSRLEAQIGWQAHSNGSQANSSKVYAELQIRRSDAYYTKGTWSGSLSINKAVRSFSQHLNLGNSWTVVSGFTIDSVSHNNDGTGTCNIWAEVYGPAGTSMSDAYAHNDVNVTLDTIPRYANFTKHEIASTTINSISVKWTADVPIDKVEYSLNGNSYRGTNGNTYIISGLSPNTTYRIKTRIKRKDSGLWTESGEITGKTRNIGLIYGTNFNLGDNPTVSITQPGGGAKVDIGLFLADASTNIYPYVTTNSGSYTFNLSDAQDLSLYKQIGTSKNIKVRFYARTSQNNKTYYDYSEKTCTLTGNIKTIWKKVNGSWKHGKIFEGNHKGITWIKSSGIWKKGI